LCRAEDQELKIKKLWKKRIVPSVLTQGREPFTSTTSGAVRQWDNSQRDTAWPSTPCLLVRGCALIALQYIDH